jgi:O-antigen/teichoic acid export membrane protein
MRQQQLPTQGRAASVGVISGGLWAFGFRVLNALSGVLLVMLVARRLPQADTGRYFSVLSLVSIAAIAANCGAGAAAVKLIAQALAERNMARARGVVDLSFRMVLAGGFATGTLLALPWTRELLRDQMNLDRSVSFLLVWLWICGSALQTVLAEIFRGIRNLFMASLFSGALSTLMTLAMLGACSAAMGPGSFPVNDVFLAAALANLLSAALAAACLLGFFRGHPREARRSWPELLHISVPFWATQVVLAILLQADIWILQGTGDSAAVALYGTAVRMTLLLTLPLAVMNAALLPVISAQHALARHDELQILLRAAASLAALPALAAVALFATAGHAMLGVLFGDKYQGALPLLLVLSLGQIVNILCGCAGYTLMMTGQQREMMWITIVSGLVMIACGLSVVHWLGAFGLRVRQTQGLWTHASWHGMTRPLTALRQLQ